MAVLVILPHVEGKGDPAAPRLRRTKRRTALHK
jgi:hypothetical protein